MIPLCCLANTINYVDRANLTVAAPSMQREFGIDAAMMGLILSGIFWTYSVMQIPFGWFEDGVGARISLALAVVWRSAFTTFTAVANSVATSPGCRLLLLGVGEANAYASCAKVTTNWFPRSERGLASSIFNSGSRIGSALSLLLVAWLIGSLGWRASFVATASTGRIVGATLGNDVNLRDFEGRSALLLSKAKDNDASTVLGPFLRLFDGSHSLDDVRRAEVALHIEGEDGFVPDGISAMDRISRDPEDVVQQTIGATHQYPDGLVLFLGTIFAPTQERDGRSSGFTHKAGDVVVIGLAKLGTLVNRVRTSDQAPPWRFGVRALTANLAAYGLLQAGIGPVDARQAAGSIAS